MHYIYIKYMNMFLTICWVFLLCLNDYVLVTLSILGKFDLELI